MTWVLDVKDINILVTSFSIVQNDCAHDLTTIYMQSYILNLQVCLSVCLSWQFPGIARTFVFLFFCFFFMGFVFYVN
jgi:hypothetical protein